MIELLLVWFLIIIVALFAVIMFGFILLTVKSRLSFSAEKRPEIILSEVDAVVNPQPQPQPHRARGPEGRTVPDFFDTSVLASSSETLDGQSHSANIRTEGILRDV
jgi:hypothetical protein